MRLIVLPTSYIANPYEQQSQPRMFASRKPGGTSVPCCNSRLALEDAVATYFSRNSPYHSLPTVLSSRPRDPHSAGQPQQSKKSRANPTRGRQNAFMSIFAKCTKWAPDGNYEQP